MAVGKYRRSHRSVFARRSARIPLYARVAIPLLLAILIGRLVWRTSASSGPSESTAVLNPSPGLAVAPWQRDIAESLAQGLHNSESGNITAAEIAVDRAESLITAARLQSQPAKAQFFSDTDSALDGVLALHAQDNMLLDHVIEARVSLAELRSVQDASDSQAGMAESGTAKSGFGQAASNAPSAPPGAEAETPPVIQIAAPRQIAAHATLNVRSLGADYLDAKLMPDTAEILMPPITRSFTDEIRVEGITIAGAAQTLDGIHWRNVTFIGTRLRYEGGDLELDNVHFRRCRFGFPSDERGARLASAIALGQSSISIDESATSPPHASARR